MAAIPAASALFRTASKALKVAAAREFRQTSFGKLVDEVKRGHLRPETRRRLRAMRSGDVRRMTREFMGRPFGDTVRNLERYAKMGSHPKRVVNQLLDSLGPTGTLIRSLFGAGDSMEGSLRAASNLLRTFGYEILPPHDRGKFGDWDRGVAAAMERLRSLGYTIIPPSEEDDRAPGMRMPTEKTRGPKASRLPFGVPEKTKRGAPRKTVDLPTMRGTRRFRVDHPAVTGEMVVAQSSNVHSYGYDAEHGYLYVRFLDSLADGSRSGPGPLYRYSGVDPNEFGALHRAGSKGNWIWDHLRIRGTVSGHKKDYELVGIVRGYVPRKAVLDPAYGGEAYIKRRVLTSRGRWLESQRPNALAAGGATIGRVGTAGTRGEPNRGRPNTGRPAPVNRGR